MTSMDSVMYPHPSEITQQDKAPADVNKKHWYMLAFDMCGNEQGSVNMFASVPRPYITQKEIQECSDRAVDDFTRVKENAKVVAICMSVSYIGYMTNEECLGA